MGSFGSHETVQFQPKCHILICKVFNLVIRSLNQKIMPPLQHKRHGGLP